MQDPSTIHAEIYIGASSLRILHSEIAVDNAVIGRDPAFGGEHIRLIFCRVVGLSTESNKL